MPRRWRGHSACARRVVERNDRVVRFVSLASVREPVAALSLIGRELGLGVGATGTSIDALCRALAGPPLLLVLDNLEQIAGAGPMLAALLAGCSGLTILATSRAALRVRAEREFPVQPLAHGEEREVGRAQAPDDAVAAHPPSLAPPSDAVALFVERARAVKPSFALTAANAADVAAICARLDGLPLAIELAAARIAVLSPAALLAHLDRRMTVLTGGAGDLPARQRTLARTVAWSYDLLSAADQVLFRRLAVFAGGFTIEGAEAVAEPDGPPVLDGIERLVAQSLLDRDRTSSKQGAEPRFRMLETVREFALAELAASGELDAVALRWARWCVALAEQAETRLVQLDRRDWLYRLDVERDNLRSALGWALAIGGSRASAAGTGRLTSADRRRP